MMGDFNYQVSWHLPLWLHFPPLWPDLFKAVKPDKVKALVAHFDLFTRVEGDTEQGFPFVPPVEPVLAAILLPKTTLLLCSITACLPE